MERKSRKRYFRITMCLYPKLITNRRYCKTKKNKGVVPPCPDERLKQVTAACGECYECRKQKQRAWVTRMTEENRQTPNAYFLTPHIVTGKQIGRAHV